MDKPSILSIHKVSRETHIVGNSPIVAISCARHAAMMGWKNVLLVSAVVVLSAAVVGLAMWAAGEEARFDIRIANANDKWQVGMEKIAWEDCQAVKSLNALAMSQETEIANSYLREADALKLYGGEPVAPSDTVGTFNSKVILYKQLVDGQKALRAQLDAFSNVSKKTLETVNDCER